jgi:hypothetical protein
MFHTGRPEAAEAAFKIALVINPDFYPAGHLPVPRARRPLFRDFLLNRIGRIHNRAASFWPRGGVS